MSSNPLCALKIMGVSSSGPGAIREVEIPALNLTFDEEGTIDTCKSREILSTPAVVYELKAEKMKDLKVLIKAREDFEAAARYYELAKKAFNETETGTWIQELLHPDSPLPETLEARLPPGKLDQLMAHLKAESVEPAAEEITLCGEPKFREYSVVKLTLNFKFGIATNKFKEILFTLGWKEISCSLKGKITISASIYYGSMCQPYRMEDAKKLSMRNTLLKEMMRNKLAINEHKEGFQMPKVVFPGVTLEDHARYMAEQIRVFKHT